VDLLTKRYVLSNKNLQPIFTKIVEGVAPPKFNADHLKSIGYGSSNDRAFIPLLKDLGFLTSDGTPTPRYQQYRDGSQSKSVMAGALRDAYEDVFHIREMPTTNDRAAIEGLFKSKHNSNDLTAGRQAATFLGLLGLADLRSDAPQAEIPAEIKRPEVEEDKEGSHATPGSGRRALNTELHYTIQVHLPATKDIEVFNAIFRSLRENLLA
jgi:Family of unknown function (DUF5343)